ncbi:alpha/beta hydrolase [Actinoplanes sp. NPDC049599]|uniref:alpha/beta hydrolase n=1 Tax=Actinoplanes sp. NPDC049599 TaxID=3363903 RepID=UPI0037AD0721
MMSAQLHDNSPLEVSVLGDGPAVLLPISIAPIEGAAAEELRAWGADPDVGHSLATGLADAGYRVIAAGYEAHLAAHPKPRTLTAAAVAADLLAIADAAGAERFAYYGYSWLALAGLQLATRTDRLAALAMGGFPPLDAPYGPMLAVTHAAHRIALANRDQPAATGATVQPGDWDSADGGQTPDQAQQYVTLYESLQDFDERAALDRLTLPRLVFAGAEDNIRYGPRWGDTYVAIADAVRANRDQLTKQGWTVELLAGADHLGAMHADRALALLLPWLRQHWC